MKIIFFLITFLIPFLLISQNSGEVIYKFVDVTKQPLKYHLYFENDKSIFVTNQGEKKKVLKALDPNIKFDTISLTELEFKQAIQLQKPLFNYYFDPEGDAIYKNFSENIFILRVINRFNPIIVTEDKIPTQKWNLIDSTKKIGNFTCLKANTIFRGREYDAWYTIEIPNSNGPWKFNGLPGLILEVNSTDKDHSFSYTFLELEVPLKNPSIIKKPLTGEKIDVKVYQSEMIRQREEKIKKLNSINSSREGKSFILLNNYPFQELNYDDLKK